MTPPPAPPFSGPDTPASEDDRVMLEGPHSRLREFLMVLKVVREFVRGFRGLHFVGPCITVFGSARYREDHPYYALGREVGGAITRLGFTVMTGGGPGIMEAANRGAREAGGRSVGCNITLPHEQSANPYLDRYVVCYYFFVRKVLLFKYSYGFVVLPGGLGTLDEMTEALTLIQTGKVRQFPVVLMGSEYWEPFTSLMKRMVEAGTVSPSDLDLMMITDSVGEAMSHLERHAIHRFGLTRRKAPKASRILGERSLHAR